MNSHMLTLTDPDGKVVTRGTHDQLFAWVLNNKPFSFSSAMADQGYTVERGRVAKTSLEHFRKYREMCADVGLRLDTSGKCFAGYTREDLVEKFDDNPHLNNLALMTFDQRFGHFRSKKNGPKSLAENCCMLKHALIYQVVGARPVIEWSGAVNWLDGGVLMYAPLSKDGSIIWHDVGEVDFDRIDPETCRELSAIKSYLERVATEGSL